MTSSRLISTACDLQGRSIHFEYIFFSLHKAKIMCSGHEKTKSTFTLLGTGCEGGLPNYRCFYSCWCFYLFCFVLFFFGYDYFVFIYLCVFFVQTSTNVLAGYTNAALVRFATIPKVHTIAHANKDSREMDENVKVVVRSINNYVVKKIKLTFANYPQGDGNLHLDPPSKKMYSETERRRRYIWTRAHWKILFLITKVFLHQLESMYS